MVMSTELGTIADGVHPEERLLVSVGTGGTCLCVEGQSKIWLDRDGREALIALLQLAPSYGAP
jgi:hypothetical protein